MTPRAKNQILMPWLIAWSKSDYSSNLDEESTKIFDEYAQHIIKAYPDKIDPALKIFYEEILQIALSNLTWLEKDKTPFEYQIMLKKIYDGFNIQLLESLERRTRNSQILPTQYNELEDKIYHYYSKISRELMSESTKTSEAKEAYNKRIIHIRKEDAKTANKKFASDMPNVLGMLINHAKEKINHRFFRNKIANTERVIFLEKLQKNLNKVEGDIADEKILNAMLDAANDKPMLLHQALQSKRVNTNLIEMLTDKPQPPENLLSIALKQKLINTAGELGNYTTIPWDRVGESMRNIYKTTLDEIDELKDSLSPKLKTTKIDFLCELLKLLKPYKNVPLKKCQDQIKQDLFEFLRLENNLKYFNQAIDGSRVKKLVSEVTGISTKELLKQYQAETKQLAKKIYSNPSMSAADIDPLTTVRSTIKVHMDAAYDHIQNHRFVFASKVLRDINGFVFPTMRDVILPKFKDLNARSSEDLKQLALLEKDVANFYRLGAELTKWEINNNDSNWDLGKLSDHQKSCLERQMQFEGNIASILKMLNTEDVKQLEKSFSVTDITFNDWKKIIESNPAQEQASAPRY